MGGKKEQGARTPYEAPNSLSSAQSLRIIDAVAEGELAGFGHGDDAPLKSVFFNDTPVQNADNSFNFKGVEAFFVRGTPDQPYIPGFAATERTVAVGAAVKRNTPIVRAVSNTQTDRLRVTVGVERNLSVQENGDTVAAVTELVVELVGNRGVAAMQTVHFSEKSSGAYYQDVDFNGLPPVPFNIRVRRNTPDSDSDRVVNNTFFASYVEITDIKLSYPHTALAALKIDSDQFGNQIPRRNYLLRGKLLQVPSNYNPETRQYTGLWDGSFKTAWTNNPVWVFYDLLTNPRYSTLARRLTAADIDKWALYEIAKYCDAPVPDGFGGEEPRFVCNAYITDARQAADVLSDLAAAFCALPVWDGQRLSLRADTAAEPVAQYSNANVVDGAFAYAGAALKAVHTAVHVRYADKHDGLQVGGRNYVLNSNRSTANYLGFAQSPDLTVDAVRGKTLTVSCDIVCQGVRAGSRNRIGMELHIQYADGSSAWVGAWRNYAHTAGDFAGRVSQSHVIADKPISYIGNVGIYNQTGGGTATVARPKLEIGNVATDWSPAPEDNEAATAAVAAELTAYKKAQATTDAAQTAELQSAKSQIGQQTAALEQIRSTKADKTQVAALARQTLSAEWQRDIATAKEAAAADAQRKADAAKAAAASAAETADRNVLQQAAREAQAKADAAKRAAETAASADATAKANAAKAQAKADAAADASTKAETAKNAAIAEAQRLNTAANARINELQNTVANNREAAATQISSLTAKLGADTNLINPATTQAGYYISESSGNVLNWATHVLTDFVPVAAGQTYTFTSAVPANNLRWAWYNARHGFVSGQLVGGDSVHQTLIAPTGAAFVRLSGGTERNTHAFALRLDPTAAAVEAERTARVNADNALTRELNTAKSQIGTAQSQLQTLQSTVANNDRAQSERTAALTAKVGTAEATVRTAQTAVTALNGKVQAMHTLKVQAVGSRKAVAGIALGADGQTGDSQFVVMADKFALARPGGNTVQMPFVVTTVGGQAQLALAGDMLVDGLIQGKHIAAGQTIRTPKLVAATLEIGSFTMQPNGAFMSRSTAPNQAGLSIDNDRIVIRDASGRVRIILGRLR